MKLLLLFIDNVISPIAKLEKGFGKAILIFCVACFVIPVIQYLLLPFVIIGIIYDIYDLIERGTFNYDEQISENEKVNKVWNKSKLVFHIAVGIVFYGLILAAILNL